MYKYRVLVHSKNGDKMKIKEIMTKNLVTASPYTTLEEASNIMKNYDIGFLPIEKDNDYIGVITDRDMIIRAFANGKSAKETLEEYMTDYLITVSGDTEIEDALKIMASERIKRLMIEEKDSIIGMISLSDILANSKDDDYLEYVIAIFEPFEEVEISNEIDIPQAEVDEFEL